jgi:DNA-binding NarL/FixJ family response regulator
MMDLDSGSENVRVVVSTYAQLPLDGTTACLNAMDGIEVVGGSTDPARVCQYINGHKPDVKVMMPPPGMARIEHAVVRAVDCLGEYSPSTKLVIVSYTDNPEVARLSLRAGARGHVLISEGMAQLGEAVLEAARGEIYVNPRLLATLATADGDFPDGLTQREREVLNLLARGYSNAEAAGEMFLSVRTIESYRASIYDKLGIHSRREVVEYAIQHELVP